jgi:protein-disulfide isomerase
MFRLFLMLWLASAGDRYKATLGHAPVRGPADARVTIVVFADYQCPFCAAMLPVFDRVMSEHPKDIRIAWRQRPLTVMHSAAGLAAEAALAAREQKKFWEMNALLYAHPNELAPGDLEGYAEKIGIDRGKFKAALADHRFAREVEDDSAAGLKLGAIGTPTIFINGRAVHGYLSYEEMNKVLDEELAFADGLLQKGTPRARLYEHILAGAKAEAPREDLTAPTVDVEVGDAPSRGPANAPVTIVEFGDFQCPYCGRVEQQLGELRKIYGKKIRFVWKDYPLPMHPQAMLAAEAARAAGDQGKFWPMHDWLLAHQDSLGLTSIEEAARHLGCDMAKFSKTLDAWQHRPQIDRDLAQVDKLGVSGTPTLFINGRKLQGILPTEQLRDVVDRALAK